MNRIDGTTRLAAVVGHPLAHTLSPAMHNAAYAHLGLNWVYVPLDLADVVGLRRFVALAPSLDCVGFNVTMPHKREMLELCDEVATTASMAGAVNTVHIVDGRTVGYNTDARGLLEALEAETGFVAQGKRVAILGSGGAAGAAFVALVLARAASITLVGRRVEGAEELLARMAPHLQGVEASVTDTASAEAAVSGADLVINATPVGMGADDDSPVPAVWLHGGQTVFDMVYGTPRPTALVEAARAAGAAAVDGLGMLVCQAALAIDIWNAGSQSPAPRDVMRQAALAQLERRTGRRD